MKRHRSDGTRNDGACPEQAQRVEGLSRRDAFKTAAAIAAAPFLLREADAAQRPPVPEDAGTLERQWREAPRRVEPISSGAAPS